MWLPFNTVSRFGKNQETLETTSIYIAIQSIETIRRIGDTKTEIGLVSKNLYTVEHSIKDVLAKIAGTKADQNAPQT